MHSSQRIKCLGKLVYFIAQFNFKLNGFFNFKNEYSLWELEYFNTLGLVTSVFLGTKCDQMDSHLKS